MESTPSPLPPGLAGYTWRPVRPEDAPAVRRLLRVCDLTPGASGATYTREGSPSIERVLAGHGGSVPAMDTLCAADARRGLVAVAWARVPPGVRHQYRGLLLGAVHPAHRRRGLGTSLLRWAEARALLAGLPDDREKVLRIEFPGEREDAGPVYERRGFRLGHVELEMERELRGPLPAGELPDGLALVPWAPERAGRFYATCRDAFSTRPGPGMWTQDEWVTGFAGGETFRPDLSWLAVGAGDEAAGAGYIMCDVRQSPGTPGAGVGAPRRPVGGIRQVGVRPAWRSRGVASALLGAALRAFRAEGIDRAHLEVNENNPTARRLYARLGFEVAGRYTVYTKSLSTPW